MNMENKVIGGILNREFKQIERDGKPIGIVKGYIATYDIDRGDDKFLKGAFEISLAKQKAMGKTHLPLKDFHGRTIGGFPVDSLKEDEKGLFGEGEINLDIQQGREAYSLAQQGVYDSFSIGYVPKEVEFIEGIRLIKEAEVLEGSILDIPMNEAAVVTEVKELKGATPFVDLPLARRNKPWDANAAKERVRDWAGADDGLDTAEIQKRYRKCFFWYKEDDPEVFASYKLPFTDIIDGKQVAVPRGIFAAAAAIQGARGGVDIPEGDKAAVISHIEKYYEKLGLDSPFTKKRAFRIDDPGALDERQLERLLRKGVSFTTKEAKKLVSLIKEAFPRDDGDDSSRDGELDEAKAAEFCSSIDDILNKGGTD